MDNEKLAAVPAAELRELRRIAAEAAAPGPEGDRALLKRTGDQIRHQPVLMPWMLAYAEWLCLECMMPPKVSSRLAKARQLARSPVSPSHIKVLEARLDFQAYQRELERGPLERARAKFQAAFPEYVEAHKEALVAAREAGDYKAVGALAEPVLDRVYPKKAEAAQATQVNIVLTPQQVHGVTAYEAPPMLVEEVAPEPSSDSGA